MWVQSALLPTGARVVPRSAPMTNLISHLDRGFIVLSIGLKKRPIFATSLCKIAGCNYSYINQLCGKSRKLVSRIKVSLFSSWRANETERGQYSGYHG